MKIVLIIGIIVTALMYFFMFCLCRAASKADKEMEELFADKETALSYQITEEELADN